MEQPLFEQLVGRLRIPLEGNVKPGGEVLVMGDTGTEPEVLSALAAAVRSVGAEPSVMVIELKPAPNMEPPRAAAAAIMAVDIMVNATSHSIIHTEAVHAAMAKGIKYTGMASTSISTLTEGAGSADPQEVLATTRRLADLMTAASTARVTSPLGTDVTMDLRGRTGLILAAGHSAPGQTVVNLASGEAPIPPVEEGTEGIIVFDTYMNPVGRLNQPVRLKVERGRVTSIEGGPEADTLRDYLASKHDDRCYFIGEFAIGTNPKSRLGDKVETKSRLGTVHFGIGDNLTLAGKNQAPSHLDGLILEPTVYLDGEVVVERGKLRG